MARVYRDRGTAAYSELQQAEFAAEADGYTATHHQREVGTGYLDHVLLAITAARRQWRQWARRRNDLQWAPS